MDKKRNDASISAAIRNACQTNFGVLDSSFLCQSLGILKLANPVTVGENDSLHYVISILKDQKVACVIVLNKAESLKGIFTERDCVTKICGNEIDLKKTPVSEYMTKDPVTATPEFTIAYALNLMSLGGFRHLPLVDGNGMPIGVVSIKDVMDHIVESFTNDLLGFETE